MIEHKGEQAVTVRALRGAAPYIHMYKGKVFVIKASGGHGERVTIVEFEHQEGMRAWRTNPDHIAAQKLAQEKPGQTLQATALVHEAYIRLVDVEKAQHWNSRGHFFAAAAEAMRR